MTPTEAENVLAGLSLEPAAAGACAPRYDEVLLTVVFNTESLLTVVYRATKHGEVRVIQLVRDALRWSLLSANSAPTEHVERRTPAQLRYPERTFHLVPGTGEAPEWVDNERPSR